ncbi:putative ADP-ribosylation factor, partial [Cardiosporidium cionae]
NTKRRKNGILADTNQYHPHIFFCGPKSSGKTTLLYKTIIPDWMDITKYMCPSTGFHYEEFYRNGSLIGCWDVSGNEGVENCWASFYRTVKMSGIVYVINTLNNQAEYIRKVKTQLIFLCTDGALRDACIAAILNTFDSRSVTDEYTFAYTKHLHDVKEISKDKLRWYVVNVKNGQSDAEWCKALDFLLEFSNKTCCSTIQ